jgi:dihydroxy-acid dehydratase
MGWWSGIPEAQVGGPIAIVRNGDAITINAEKKELTLHLSAAEIRRRLNKFKSPRLKYRRGVLSKFARSVSSAADGAITDSE